MRKDFRSAVTGRYVTAKFARKHPETTVSEPRKPPPPDRGAGKRSK